MAFIIYIDNDNLIELTGLNDKDGLINDATVEVTIVDTKDLEVEGIVWPLTMDPTGSNGDYEAVIDKAAEFLENTGYRAIIIVTASAGRDGKWEKKFTPQLRSA